MPKIYEYFGFTFYFYSNEHEPIHVHLIHGDRYPPISQRNYKKMGHIFCIETNYKVYRYY